MRTRSTRAQSQQVGGILASLSTNNNAKKVGKQPPTLKASPVPALKRTIVSNENMHNVIIGGREEEEEYGESNSIKNNNDSIIICNSNVLMSPLSTTIESSCSGSRMNNSQENSDDENEISSSEDDNDDTEAISDFEESSEDDDEMGGSDDDYSASDDDLNSSYSEGADEESLWDASEDEMMNSLRDKKLKKKNQKRANERPIAKKKEGSPRFESRDEEEHFSDSKVNLMNSSREKGPRKKQQHNLNQVLQVESDSKQEFEQQREEELLDESRFKSSAQLEDDINSYASGEETESDCEQDIGAATDQEDEEECEDEVIVEIVGEDDDDYGKGDILTAKIIEEEIMPLPMRNTSSEHLKIQDDDDSDDDDDQDSFRSADDVVIASDTDEKSQRSKAAIEFLHQTEELAVTLPSAQKELADNDKQNHDERKATDEANTNEGKERMDFRGEDPKCSNDEGFEVCKMPQTVAASPVTFMNQVLDHQKKGKHCRSKKRFVEPGRWKLGSKIGTGSFGVVHVGMNTNTGTLIAVKSIHMQKTIMEDTKREIELLGSLEHPNIVCYYGGEVNRAKSHLYIFQEWLPGGSVTSLLKRFGRFDIAVVRNYLSQIICGLAYLHENCVMHRDIKGSNILVNDSGIVKLADFGGSKRLSNLHNDMTMEMTVRGTPYFMAPEVFEERYSIKADIWSVGCVAYQMLTGTPPWKNLGIANPVALFNHVKSTEGPPKIEIPKMAPEIKLLESLLIRCFHRTPHDRPSADELSNDPFLVEVLPLLEDEQTENQGLCSPGSTCSWDLSDSPQRSKESHTMFSRHRRRNSIDGSRKSPMFSPPVPKPVTQARVYASPARPPQSPKPNTSEWVFASPAGPPQSPKPNTSGWVFASPARPPQSPKPNTSEWPSWALNKMGRMEGQMQDSSKERTKIEALTDNNLVNSLDSLAFSEDATSDRCPDMETSTTTVGQSFSTGTSASSTPLVGLKILDNM